MFLFHAVDGEYGRLVVLGKEPGWRLRLYLGIEGTKQDPILDGVLRQYRGLVITVGYFLTTVLRMNIFTMDDL